jgi:hypothetical protein
MTVTIHAKNRIKERMGLKKSSSEKVAYNALAYGLRHEDVAGSLKRFLDKLYFEHLNANNIRIFADKIFLFHNDFLITVINLPSKFRNTVEKIKKQIDVRENIL